MAPTLRSMVVFNLVSGWLARLLHVERQSRAQISRPLVYVSVNLSGCAMEGFRQKLRQEGVNEQTLLILEEEDNTNTETLCVLWPQHFEL